MEAHLSERELVEDAPILKVDGVNSRQLYDQMMIENFREIFGYDFDRYHGCYIKHSGGAHDVGIKRK